MNLDLGAFGYRPAEDARLWLPAASAETSFAYNDGDAHETYVSDVIRKATDVSVLSRELADGMVDWESTYHLTTLRANIVRPLLDVLEGPVLELGAGMGAVTRALGEAGLEVVALEGSPRRATACADRCRDLPNVQVVCDTIQSFNPGPVFSAVVMIGVLEYSRAFGVAEDGRDPVDVVLEHVASLLRPGGQLVVAIENQLGLKYLASFPEDHLGRRMVGVEDRYRADGVVTFGREELSRRIGAAGLGHQEWLFPFPDYKLPTVVVSERALAPEPAIDVAPLIAGTARHPYQQGDSLTFDLERAWHVVARNGLVPELANSFLVRASATPLSNPRNVAWHYGSPSRRPEFTKSTEFAVEPSGVVVRRRPLVPGLATTVDGVSMVLEDEPYAPGLRWTDELDRIVGLDGWSLEDLNAWFSRWLDALVAASGIASRHADAVIGNRWIDALPRNLLVDGDRTAFVDLEWAVDQPLTLDFVVFRALYDSIASLGRVAQPAEGTPLEVQALLTQMAGTAGFPLDDDALERLWQRECEFQSVVQDRNVDVPWATALDVALQLRGVPEDPALLRNEVAQLRTEVSGLRDIEAELRAEVARRGVELDHRAEELARLREEIERRGAEIDRLKADLTRKRAELRLRNAEVERRDTDLATQGAEIVRLKQELAAKATALQAAEDSLAYLEEQYGRNESSLQQQVAQLAHTLHLVQASVSWRVTRPLRGVRRLVAGQLPGRRPPAEPTQPEPEPEPKSTPLAEELPDFDAAYYRMRYSDLTDFDDEALLAHYLHHGRAEGRRAHPLVSSSSVNVRAMRPGRETVFVLFHEATRTGAPVLGWNIVRELERTRNVVAVIMKGGELIPHIEDVASATVVVDASDLGHGGAEGVAIELAARFSPAYAVANSAATHALAPALERAGVPVVALVHEFASSIRPAGVLSEFYGTVSEVVFSAEIVARSMTEEYSALLARSYRVHPQGPALLPPGAKQAPAHPDRRGTDGVLIDLPEQTMHDYLADLDRDALLVVGAGTISPRKGIEFFLQAAEQARKAAPGKPVRFAWIGERPDILQWYVDSLWEQVKRTDALDHVTFLAATPDLDPLYQRADVFFLSSRLDPMPNVTVDAALAGIPVVAFSGASGFADWLAENPRTAELVVPHLDAAAAGSLIGELCADEERRAALAGAVADAARKSFDRPRYVTTIDAIGMRARDTLTTALEDVKTVEDSGDLGLHLFHGGQDATDQHPYAVSYVLRSRLAAPRSRARTGLLVPRPADGFHPLVYAEQAPDYVEERDGDPFADFLRKGRPAGPWLHRVILPTEEAPEPGTQRVLVHGHFHYPELLPELVDRLEVNTAGYDVVLTTTDEARAAVLLEHLTERHLTWDVKVVPNRGRDMGPFLTGLGWSTIADYDAVLHIHGKRSVHVEDTVSDRWRELLWENLVGGRSPMLDVLVANLAGDPKLGLVFPQDPGLSDWDLNRDEAEKLAARLGLEEQFPNHFEFPIGNMFLARPQAIRPLFDLELDWADYPAEPLPIDGTMLHALERISPFVARAQGFEVALTRVPGVQR